MKKYLIIFTKPPHASYENLEAVELALGLAAFEQTVGLLFLGDSVLQLLKLTDNNLVPKKNFTKVFAGLEMFDITNVYADKNALAKYQINIPELISLETDDVTKLIATYDIVLQV